MASPAALPATGGVKNEAEVDATSFSGPRNPQTALVQPGLSMSISPPLESNRLQHPWTG